MGAARAMMLAGVLCWWLAQSAVVEPRLMAAKADKSKAAKTKKNAPKWPEPALHIPVAQMGYMPAGVLPAYSSETSLVTLDYVDADHLLFTFNRRDLLPRIENDPPKDEDRLVQGNVIELPSGRSLAQKEWRMHDHGRYLWAIGDGQFLFRERSDLRLLDAGAAENTAELALKPYLKIEGKLRSVYVSADKELAVLQFEVERHSPEEHKQLTRDALLSGNPPPGEDVEVRFMHLHPPEVFRYLKARTTVYVPAVGNLVLETIDQLSGHWLLQSKTFDGKIEPVARLDSTCAPDTRFLNAETVLTVTCQDGKADRMVRAFHIEGGELWHFPARAQELMGVTLAASGHGERFAMSTLSTLRVLAKGEPMHEEDIAGQYIEVIDTATGKRLLKGPASPLYASGQNFALSPDGLHFAMVRDGFIDVFDLPPVGK